MEQIQAVINTIVVVVPVLATIVGGFAVLASMTPNRNDDRIVQFLLDIVNFMGANIGKAANKKE